MNMINEFKGEYRFLSNMYILPCGTSAEHLYQTAKAKSSGESMMIMGVESPYDAKRMGRKIKLRDDWSLVSDLLMYNVVMYKFLSNRQLGTLLVNTGDLHIVEGNTWHDNIWGDCSCGACGSINGMNKLGNILMSVRSTIKHIYTDVDLSPGLFNI